MAEFPAFPLFTDAYLGDTTHLTTIEHGAYLLLIITMWRTKTGSLPDDDKLLARYTRLTSAQWARIKPIIETFFDIHNGQWTQGRLTDELIAVRQLSKRQSDKAKGRWLKNKEKNKPRQCRTDASPTPPLIEDTNVSSPPTPKPKISYDEDFEDFWKGWVPYDMDKGSKEKAKKVYEKSRKEVTHEIIIGKRDQYLAECHRHQRRTTHASTWLNPTGNRGWADDYSTPATQPSCNNRGNTDSQLRDRVHATARQIDYLLGES